MANSHVFTFLIVTLTVTQVAGLFFIHSVRQEKVGGSKTDESELISQATFNPPNGGKPKGSSGAGSRRMDGGDNKNIKV